MSPVSRPAVGSHSSPVGIVVNGEAKQVSSGLTIANLIRTLGLREQLVAVEVNRELVRRATFSERQLQEGDQIEIVEFVGGG